MYSQNKPIRKHTSRVSDSRTATDQLKPLPFLRVLGVCVPEGSILTLPVENFSGGDLVKLLIVADEEMATGIDAFAAADDL